MATRRQNGDGFDRLQEMTSDSDAENLGEFESGKKKKYLLSSQSTERLCPSKNKGVNRRDVICLIVGGVIVGIAVVLFIILGVVFTKSKAENSQTNSTYDYVRLPADLEPILYRVHLSPNLSTLAVSGSVVITIKVTSATNRIILHAKDMTISSPSIKVNEELGAVKSTYFIEEHDFLVIEVDNLQASDNLELSLDFNYTLRDDLVGFYLSSYKTTSGDTVRLATTQFEPTDARTAFPCFDEPAMKANFSITITHPKEYMAVSNMPVKSQTTKRQSPISTVTTEFETSYRMSSYLIAFIVSDFQCTDTSTVNNHIEVRICANPVIINSTSYAQEVTNDVIGYYEQFFGVNYPLPKQDLFAIPDFAAGAMENWGLITYRETALLYDPNENPLSSKQRVAVVIAHELAHQWFGNLVTMEWWDGLWLNEGFASYVEYIGTDHKEKDWKMLDQFFVDTIQTAYAADGLNWSHPIIQYVSDPDEINGLFDSISYDKGASLIRMLLNFISEDTFTKGLAKYLNAHKFGNAETSDLWSALNDVFNTTTLPESITIPIMMDTWTKQMGYPVIHVTISSNGKTLSYQQERFLQNPLPSNGQVAPSPYGYKWIIPFGYMDDPSSPDVKVAVLDKEKGSFDVSVPTGGFIKANYKQNGFFRVNYDNSNWQAITQYLTNSFDTKVLSGVDRAGLIDDAFALSSAGLLNITMALDLSMYLQNEREYVPWAASFTWLNILSDRLSLTPAFGRFQDYISFLINNTVADYPFGSTNLTHLETFLKTLMLRSAWETGNMDVAMTAKDMFSNWMKDSSKSIPPNLKLVVYPAGIAFGGDEEWQFLWKRYLNSYDPYEKSLCLHSLSFSKEPWILNRYLEHSLKDVRSQDTLYVIRKVSENVNGRQLAWNFFRDNWDLLFKKYGGGSFSFSRLIRTLTKSFATEWELHEVESFFEARSDSGSAALAIEQSKEIIRGNIQWVSENLDVISKWIDLNIPSAAE